MSSASRSKTQSIVRAPRSQTEFRFHDFATRTDVKLDVLCPEAFLIHNSTEETYQWI